MRDTSLENRVRILLDALDRDLQARFIDSGIPINPSFAAGHTGLAMFYAYYYRLSGDPRHLDLCVSLVEKLLTFSSENDTTYTMCNGVTGVAWLVQHLINEKIIEADNDILDDYDSYLSDISYERISNGHYDYFHGGLGCGVYFLDRPNNRLLLERVLTSLDISKLQDDRGYFWEDKFSRRDPENGSMKVNFGLAHGMPSIIFFLSQLVKMGIGGEKAISLLRGALNYLMFYSQLDNYTGCFFPSHYYVNGLEAKSYSRLGWCYGDLGVVVALQIAADVLNDKQLAQQALNMAKVTAMRRDLVDNLIADGGICHGSAGVAHINKRLFLTTNEKIFDETAEYWIQILVEEMERNGVDSFHEVIENDQWKLSYGFLAGSTGAGLALVAYLDRSTSPSWDRFLLIH